MAQLQEVETVAGGMSLSLMPHEKRYSMDNHGLNGLSRQDFYHLHLNEGFPDLPKGVLKAIKAYASDAGSHSYPTEQSRHEVIAGYREYLNRQTQVVGKNNLAIFNGSDSLLEKSLLSVARNEAFACGVVKGDSILAVGPTYRQFSALALNTGLKVWDLRNGTSPFSPNVDGIAEALTRRGPSLCYICNPNNPTGHLFSATQIESLLQKFPRTMFLVDEAYVEFGGTSVAGLVSVYKNLIVSRTMSKAFGLADARVGFGISDPENIATLDRINNAKDVSALSLKIANAALKDPRYVTNYCKLIESNKAALVDFLKAAKVAPIVGSGNFVGFMVPPERTEALVVHLAEHGVIVRDLSALVPGFIRVTVIGDSGAVNSFSQAFPVDLSTCDPGFKWLDYVEQFPRSFWPKRCRIGALQEVR